MKKSVEEKSELVNKYYENASKHVFQDTVDGVNKDNFFKVGLVSKQDSEDKYAYSIEIINDSVYIEIKKISDSDKAEHSVKWFPVYFKRKAIRQFQKLSDVMEMLEVYTKTIIDYEEIKYGYKRMNFRFSDKFNKKIDLEKFNQKVLEK